MKNYFAKVIVVIVFLISVFGIFHKEVSAASVYSDISNAGFKTEIEYLNSQDAFDNVFVGKFNENQAITRLESVRILYNLYEEILPKQRNYASNTFTDVKATDKNYKYIIWSYEVGIFDGDNKKRFNPNSTLTRAQMAKILVNTFSLENQSDEIFTFKDTKNQWFEEFVSILYTNQITVGDNGLYKPNNVVTRGHFTAFLYRIATQDNNEAIGADGRIFASEYENVSWTIGYTEPSKTELVDFHAFNDERENIGGYISNSKTLFDVHINKDTKKTVRTKLGEPIEGIIKDNTLYQMKSNQFDMYLIDEYYVTVFYDTYDSNIVRSLYWMEKSYEENKNDYYGTNNKELRDSNEEIMSILVNNFRTSKGFNNLTYTPEFNFISRNHSIDMDKNNYFSHTNKQGLSFDQRISNVLKVSYAGENIAYGQFNVFYMHEAFVNSLGHRENMLVDKFNNIIVGFEFGSKHPYITINFYTFR